MGEYYLDTIGIVFLYFSKINSSTGIPKCLPDEDLA
jgi:hypothetical protein